MATKLFQKRVDVELLDEVSAIYKSLGTSVGEAFVMFLKKSEEVRGLPFELRQPSAVSDEELERLLLTKLEKRTIDAEKTEDAAHFFDEDFPEYNEVMNG
ncbi:putative DNA-damage-inducible protein J [Streptococcus sp. DD11]|uniref:type II toxin-antitoxin system RelB/DinJ family antitoxin n=1 Tax=Streptococcus sp. DD11 TaxID=1777879 RepID=UPI0007940884|nr:type II toxin-antitoxin system RelB/DinJ family antitoxin [Streptococcus sp. DD11]KXT83325.1 putative DNA-damage-inducible protein J [Streptococcus sp. DD11]